MTESERRALAGQFAAALDMLGNAIEACPEAAWGDMHEHAFWYLAHHTLFWTDCYLSETPIAAYRPPAPFGLEELDPAGVLPPAPSKREDLLAWLAHCRTKAYAHIASLTDERGQEPSGFTRLDLPRFEMLVYTLRHVHHHVGQLNLLLRQATGEAAPRWVARGGAGVNRG